MLRAQTSKRNKEDHLGSLAIVLAKNPYAEEVTAHAVKGVETMASADISRIRAWSDEAIREFLIGGKDGDERDAFVWADVVREARRRDLDIKPEEAKYDFY